MWRMTRQSVLVLRDVVSHYFRNRQIAADLRGLFHVLGCHAGLVMMGI